ncbi:MAG: MFS transporter [Oleispira sp.]|nr:MFS transporter [Oleispira sp.]
MDVLHVVGSLLGGIGLFMLAIGMMTDGLKVAAGPSLRNILSRWSNTPLRGIFSGFVMTSIVQSSSAITVASLGFVNAGLINMRQALGIIYGSNIGTTMTAWLVALVGFQFKIHDFALPMVGVGMILKMSNKKGTLASFGLALVGFGLFFVGVDILKNAFEGLVTTFDITLYKADGISGVLLFLFVGIVMTVLTQSSSASIALTITAISSDMIGLYAAGAMVIGANIGTTSTAVIASIGATSNAKRAAAAQVIFNAVTAVLALALLPFIFIFIKYACELLNIDSDSAISLALFHTIFNVLGVLLIYPQNERIASFLDKKFTSWDEKASHPKFIDKTVAQTPVLAVNALLLEIYSIADKGIDLFSRAVQPKGKRKTDFYDDARVIKLLSVAVSEFIVTIDSSGLPVETREDLATLMRIDQYILNCTLAIERAEDYLLQHEYLPLPKLETELIEYFNSVLGFLMISREINKTDNQHENSFFIMQTEHDRIKAELILNGTQSKISVEQMSASIDALQEALHLSKQWHKAMTRLHAIHTKSIDEEL